MGGAPGRCRSGHCTRTRLAKTSRRLEARLPGLARLPGRRGHEDTAGGGGTTRWAEHSLEVSKWGNDLGDFFQSVNASF